MMQKGSAMAACAACSSTLRGPSRVAPRERADVVQHHPPEAAPGPMLLRRQCQGLPEPEPGLARLIPSGDDREETWVDAVRSTRGTTPGHRAVHGAAELPARPGPDI